MEAACQLPAAGGEKEKGSEFRQTFALLNPVAQVWQETLSQPSRKSGLHENVEFKCKTTKRVNKRKLKNVLSEQVAPRKRQFNLI